MSKMTVYHSEPQGLASNSGFEEEDAARAALCARNRLASVRAQILLLAGDYAAHLFAQDKNRYPGSENMVSVRLCDEISDVLDAHTGDGK